MTIQVNVTAQVNAKAIRRETINGRPHWIVPSYTLPANVVMNEVLYPASEIEKHYRSLEGRLAPLGHPMVNGAFVSASDPEAINQNHHGAFNRNVKRAGNRIYAEKFIDVEVAQRTEKGRELLQRLEALEAGTDGTPPIHTSAALFIEKIAANAEGEAQGYKWVAKIQTIDHDAILLNEVGAATPEQGVGLMVNADLATPLQANVGALTGESYREKEARLDAAAQATFGVPGTDSRAWVMDFTDDQAVIGRYGFEPTVFGYKIEAGKIVFDSEGSPVQRQSFWAPVVNKIRNFINPQAQPVTKGGDMPLTTEDQAAVTKIVTDALAANSQALAEQLKPLAQTVGELKANQEAMNKALTANQDAEEKRMREAVAKVHTEVVANALSGEALKAMFDKLPAAQNLAPNSSTAAAAQANATPDAGTYFN